MKAFKVMTLHRISFQTWFVCGVITLCLPGLARADAASEVETEDSAGRARLLVVLIGGMDSDPTPEQIAGTAERNRGNSGLYQLADDLRRERVDAEYFNWNGTRAGAIKTAKPPGAEGIAGFIRGRVQQRPWDRIAIVGNSWGGQTAREVSARLFEHETPVAVHLAVFLDASSAGRGAKQPERISINVNRIVQLRTRNVFVWEALARDRRLETIDLGDPEQGFLREKGPAYQSLFDFSAHVAAEWDQKIHSLIEQRALGTAPSP
jgi:pimeloyl-ACP methyl ester carboxylesterase